VADDAELKIDFRLVPADGRPADPVVLDDIVRLILQAQATLPREAPSVAEPADGFRSPIDDDPVVRGLERKIKDRIEQDRAASQAAVETRAQTARLPEAAEKLAEESLRAAQRVLSAVQSAMLRRVAVRVPDLGA